MQRHDSSHGMSGQSSNNENPDSYPDIAIRAVEVHCNSRSHALHNAELSLQAQILHPAIGVNGASY